MKRKLIIGSLLSVFILIMLPSISAIEFNTVKEENKKAIISRIYELDQQLEIKNILKHNILNIKENIIEKFKDIDNNIILLILFILQCFFLICSLPFNFLRNVIRCIIPGDFIDKIITFPLKLIVAFFSVCSIICGLIQLFINFWPSSSNKIIV